MYNVIKAVIEYKFLEGNYKLGELNEHGQHFAVNINVEGKRDHVNEMFNCHVGCIAWTYGKIKIATPLVKD